MIGTLLLSAVLAQGYYSPGEAQSLFTHGTEAFAKDDLKAAESDFQKLVQHGFDGPDVLYNLGTTLLAEGDVGRAVLELERARRQGGSAPDLDANLALARSRQLDQVVGAGGDEGLLPRLAGSTSGEAWGRAFLWFWALGFAVLAVRKALPRVRTPGTAWLAGLLLALAIPAGAVLAAHVYTARAITEGVVIAKSLPARDAPEEGAKVAFEVHAGLKVRLLEEQGSFVHIRLPNGLEGWTERSGVEAI